MAAGLGRSSRAAANLSSTAQRTSPTTCKPSARRTALMKVNEGGSLVCCELRGRVHHAALRLVIQDSCAVQRRPAPTQSPPRADAPLARHGCCCRARAGAEGRKGGRSSEAVRRSTEAAAARLGVTKMMTSAAGCGLVLARRATAPPHPTWRAGDFAGLRERASHCLQPTTALAAVF